jgi:hypothetical protein
MTEIKLVYILLVFSGNEWQLKVKKHMNLKFTKLIIENYLILNHEISESQK